MPSHIEYEVKQPSEAGTPLSDDAIRIFELLPSGPKGIAAPLRGKLHVTSLSSNPEYETVSYVWGSPEYSTNIEVDGHDVGISPSLGTLLRKLRFPDQTRRIWADQICIDQNNLAEKDTQVKMMGDIYLKCTRCFIWMGELPETIPPTDVDGALQFLDYLAAPKDTEVPGCLASRDTFKAMFKALFLIHPDGNVWWKRIWTVQEVILPPKKTILWGQKVLTWERLTEAMVTWVSEYVPSIYEVLDQEDFNKMNVLSANVVWINHGRIFEPPSLTATKWRSREASCLVDKVFGLRGLISEEIDLEFTNRCNYESSEATVYSSFTLDAIVMSKSLQPLILDPRLEEENATKDIPRWATDLKGWALDSADAFYRNWADGHYNACGGRALDMSLLRSTVTDHNGSSHILGLMGVMAEEVDIISPDQCTKPLSDAGISEKLRSWYGLAAGERARRSSANTGPILKEEFCRLVALDILEAREDEPQEPRRPNEEDLERLWTFVEEGKRGQSQIWINESHVRSTFLNRVFFITKSGKLGMGPSDTQLGDQVWIFDGGRYPFMTRARHQDDGNSVDLDFVGCCYVHGIMFGELYQGPGEVSTQRAYLH